METLLVRLKAHDPRRGHVLRRYTYAGIRFDAECGWYRVETPVGEYLRAVREVAQDEYSPFAFDVCTEEEARRLEAAETEEAKVRRAATDEIKVVPARAVGTVTTADIPRPPAPTAVDDKDRRKREKE